MRFLLRGRPAIQVAGDVLIIAGDSPASACLDANDSELVGGAPGRHAQLHRA